MDIDLQLVLNKVRMLVKETGAFIRTEGRQFNKEMIEYKGFNDLVSYVDKQAEIQLTNTLQKILPKAGFVTEEGTISKTGKAFTWIVDPLDGTTNFAHGLPVFAISIGLMHHDEIVLGVVYEINRDECFYAISGKSACCNDATIHVSAETRLSGALLATGFPYNNFEKLPAYFRLLNSFMQTTHGLRRMGSAAVDLVYVACGRFEGFFEYNLNAWDVAAGAFIVQQAGGKVTDFSDGNNYIFGKEIAAACGVHNEMIRVIQKHWK